MNFATYPFSYWTTKPAGLRDDAVEATRRGEQAWAKETDIHHADGVLLVAGCVLTVSILNGQETHTLAITSDEQGGGSGSAIHVKVGMPVKSFWLTDVEWSKFRDEQRAAWLKQIPSHPKGGPREAVEKLMKWETGKVAA